MKLEFVVKIFVYKKGPQAQYNNSISFGTVI